MVRWLLVAFVASSLTHTLAATDAAPAGEERRAQTAAILNAERISLADLFRLARRENASLARAGHRVEAAEGQKDQAGLYPNPVLGLEVEDASTADFDARADKISLTQPLVLGGRRGAAVTEARARASAARHTHEALEREILERVHVAWAELVYIREADTLLAGLIDTAKRSLEIAEARFEARAVPEAHVTRARLELYDLEASRRRFTSDRAGSAAELSRLLGGVAIPVDRIEGMLLDHAPDVSDVDVTAHPAFLASVQRAEAADAALRSAKAARIPDLGVYFAYGRSRPSNEDFFEAGVSIPIPIFDRNQGNVRERRALIGAEEEHRRQTEDALHAKLASARAQYEVVREELLALDTDIRPAAERSFSQARDGYWAGRTSFLELIDAQRTLASVRRRHLELKRELTVTHAALSALAGRAPYVQTGE